MNYGYLVLARRTNDWTSHLTAYITEGYFSHAFILTPTVGDKWLCIEAELEGVTASPFELAYQKNLNRDYIQFKVKVSDNQTGINSILSKLETGYGFAQMLWFLWRFICSKFGKDIKGQDNWFYKDGTLCSQLAAEYLFSAGLSYLFEGFGQGSISPNDIYKIAKSRPDLFEEVESRISNPNALSLY